MNTPHLTDSFHLLAFPIATEEDVVATRQSAREIARLLDFSAAEQTRIATAVSEISRNSFLYAGGGEVLYSLALDDSPQTLQIEVVDKGPGIARLSEILEGKFRSSTGLGIGISGSRKLVSDFSIRSSPTEGTYVRLRQNVPGSGRRLDQEQAVALREKLLLIAQINPLEELKQQNKELLTSLRTITRQREVIEANTRALERSNQERQELIATLNSALASLSEPICVYDNQGRAMYRNSQCEALLNHFAAESIAEAFRLEEQLQQVIETRAPYQPSGFEGVKRVDLDGEERVFLPTIIPMTPAEKASAGAVFSLIDVTEYELIDQLKSDLIGTLSHEVKTPTTTIRMAVQLLLEEQLGPLNQNQRGMLEAASTEIERLLRILRNLLDLRRFSKDGLQLTGEYVAPAEIIKIVLKDSHLLAQQSDVRLETALPEDLPRINVDLDRMTHALGNLVTNAIRYSPAKSTVRISAEADAKGSITFRVRDRGEGIPREYQRRIFDRFVRVPDNRKPGTGLGLYIAREFVAAHKGEIGVESAPLQGSEFYITLPAEVSDCSATFRPT